MHEHRQTTALIWGIRLALAVALAALLAFSLASRADAGVGFDYARASDRVGFSNSLSRVSFQFELRGRASKDLTVEVVRKGAGIVRSLSVKGVPPGVGHGVAWDGLNANGKPGKPGAYVFKVRNPATGRIARMKRVRGKRGFSFQQYIFPVRGSHNYGAANARYGAARQGHQHQGQDVFAPCGTRMVTPRAGTVKTNSFQGSAGNYVVITLAGTGLDAVFMHLQKRSWVSPGQKVYTGQQIGKVGETGNASGCHLHFELWSSPGWYSGGAPMDPYPTLRSWDSYS
jgi:murein DD-endopeptidase MepM/ murein hydrolase activator NlpD